MTVSNVLLKYKCSRLEKWNGFGGFAGLKARQVRYKLVEDDTYMVDHKLRLCIRSLFSGGKGACRFARDAFHIRWKGVYRNFEARQANPSSTLPKFLMGFKRLHVCQLAPRCSKIHHSMCLHFKPLVVALIN